MKIELVLVGKTSDKLYTEAIGNYCGRIGHYTPFSINTLPALKNAKNLSQSQQRQSEGELIMKQLLPTDHVVLLDEHGSERRSMEFAEWLRKKQQAGRRLVFVVGGPYGFSQTVYDRADEMVSLSRMTFSHQMVRLIFVEQLYRACTILRGEAYHHE